MLYSVVNLQNSGSTKTAVAKHS